MRSTSISTASNGRLGTASLLPQAPCLCRAGTPHYRCPPSRHKVTVAAAAAAANHKKGQGKDNNNPEGDGGVSGFFKNFMKAGMAAIGEGAVAGLEAIADKALGTVTQIAEQTVTGSAVSRRKQVLPELLGPLYTPALQQRLQSCTTVDDLFPVTTEEGQAEMSVADAAAAFVLPPRSSATEDAYYALSLESRILTGQLAGQDEMETVWLAKQQLRDPRTLPSTFKHLLAAAAVLQGSSELASAGSLAHDAQLVKALQCSTTIHVAHNLTTADILAMPRQDVPALFAALWAAEDCMNRLIGCSMRREWDASLLTALNTMAGGMLSLTRSSSSPWLHAIYVWALSQMMSVMMYMVFTGLRPNRVLLSSEWLSLNWSPQDLQTAEDALKLPLAVRRELDRVLDSRVLYQGTLVPLRAFLHDAAPMMLADTSYSMLLVEATQRKALKWRGGAAPKLPEEASQMYENYWRAMRREYALYGPEGHKALLMYATPQYLLAISDIKYSPQKADDLSRDALAGVVDLARGLGGSSQQHNNTCNWHLHLVGHPEYLSDPPTHLAIVKGQLEAIQRFPDAALSHGRLGEASHRFGVLAGTGGTQPGIVVAAAKEVWGVFKTSHHFAAYNPPLIPPAVQAYETIMPYKFAETLRQQLPVSTTHLIRAAAVVAVAEQDAEAIRFVAQAVTAMARGDLKYDGDVETIACLSLALEGQPVAALDRLLAAITGQKELPDMHLVDLRTVIAKALSQQPSGVHRLLDVLEMPGPPLPAATLQGAVMALANQPGMLPAAWKLAQQTPQQGQEGSAAVAEALWWSAVSTSSAEGDMIISSILQQAPSLPVTTVARMVIATWSEAENRRAQHQQLAGVLLAKAAGDASLSGVTTLLPPPTAARRDDLVEHILKLTQQAWQSVTSKQSEGILVQPWAMDEVAPLLLAAPQQPSAFAGQLVQSLLQGGHGCYVAEHYTTWVQGVGLQLDASQQLQLMQQAGPTQVLPTLMAGVEGGRSKAAAASLLSALLQLASSDDSQMEPTVLEAASKLLRRPDMPIDAGLCVTALQLAAGMASTAAEGALDLADAALSSALARDIQHTEETHAACISLLIRRATAAQWQEVLLTSIAKAPPATAASWLAALLEEATVQISPTVEAASQVFPAICALFSAAESQQVKLSAGTLWWLVERGLLPENANPQLAVQAVQSAQRHAQLPQVIDRLSSTQRTALASALIEAQEWGLALAVTCTPWVLRQILTASQGKQLSVDALPAVLGAAIATKRPELTVAFLETQVLANPDLKGAALWDVLGREAGVVELCKHVLGSKSEPDTSAQEQHHHGAHVLVQVIQQVVGTQQEVLSRNFWFSLLDIFISVAAAQPDSIAAGVEICTLCRVASQQHTSPAGNWNLYAAAHLASAPGCAALAVACLQDLEVLEQGTGGSEDAAAVASRLRLEFVTKVCSPSRPLHPQLQSWVAHFCQQAAEVLGEDFAVGRVTKPAVVEVARACMSQGLPRLVVLLHQAAKAEGGQDDCMPPLRQMALQAAVTTQQWEEAEERLLPKVLQDNSNTTAPTRRAPKGAKPLSPESGPIKAVLALDLKALPPAISGPLASVAMQRMWQDWAPEADIATEAVEAAMKVADWAVSSNSNDRSSSSSASQSDDAWLAAVAGANACALLALHNPLQASQQLSSALQLLSGACPASAEAQEQVLLAHARVHAACGNWSGLVGMCVASVEPPTDPTSSPTSFSSLFSIAGLPVSAVNPWALQAAGSSILKAATAMGDTAPLEANLPIMLGALTSSVILTGVARQETATDAAPVVSDPQGGEQKQQEQPMALPSVLKDPVALAALHALVKQWIEEEEQALVQVLGADVLLELAVAETSGNCALRHIPQLTGVHSIDLTAWAQYIMSTAAASEGNDKDPADTSGAGRVGWGSMSSEARREVQRAALVELAKGA